MQDFKETFHLTRTCPATQMNWVRLWHLYIYRVVTVCFVAGFLRNFWENYSKILSNFFLPNFYLYRWAQVNLGVNWVIFQKLRLLAWRISGNLDLYGYGGFWRNFSPYSDLSRDANELSSVVAAIYIGWWPSALLPDFWEIFEKISQKILSNFSLPNFYMYRWSQVSLGVIWVIFRNLRLHAWRISGTADLCEYRGFWRNF